MIVMSISKLNLKINNCIMQKENITKITDKVNEVIDEVNEGGESEVIANPTLAGTEDELTGLQVGDTKYKVGGDTPSTPFYVLEIAMGSSLSSADIAKVEEALAQTKPVYLVSSTNYDEGKEEWENSAVEGFCSRDANLLTFQYYNQLYFINSAGVTVYTITTSA